MKITLHQHCFRLGISPKAEATDAKKSQLVNLFTLIRVSILCLVLYILQFTRDLTKHRSLIGSILFYFQG